VKSRTSCASSRIISRGSGNRPSNTRLQPTARMSASERSKERTRRGLSAGLCVC
jgi:hypothetical protein